MCLGCDFMARAIELQALRALTMVIVYQCRVERRPRVLTLLRATVVLCT